ncbi:MAG: LAGLIDADG family homing endonuclease [Promethearchaeota archaeon]
MSDSGNEGGEGSSEDGDSQPDKTPDAPAETPDEGIFNPNDDAPDETSDEGLFNPNDNVPDEKSDEEAFNPNDDTPDETPDEELFNPNDDTPDETPDEELFNPNDDKPDETPDEELFNPNDDVPDDKSDENYNSSSSGQITITEQEHENEPETEPENDPEEDTEKEIEHVSPEGEPMGPVDSKETLDIRADLESWGYEPEYDPDIEADGEDQTHESETEGEQENDSESEQESESKQSTENESESEPDTKPEEFELVTPEGEPIPHPQEAPPELIPLEAAIEQLYEEQQGAEEEIENVNEPNELSEQEPEIISDQESKSNSEHDSKVKSDHNSDVILDQEPELVPQQKQEQKQKSKRIKAKRLELITDPKELDDYKHYEYQHIVGSKYDVIFREKNFKKSEKKPKSQKTKPMKVKDLKLITNSKELEDHKHYEHQHIVGTKYDVVLREKQSQRPKEKAKPQKKKIEKVKELELIIDSKEPSENKKGEKSEIEKISEKSEKSSKSVQKTDQKEIKDLELITEPLKSAESEEKKESRQEKFQKLNEKESNQKELVSSESQKQSHPTGEDESENKSETVSNDRLDLREEYKQKTGKRPIYNKRETKGFLSWLETQKKLAMKKKQEKGKEKVGEIKEEWQILLEKWVGEASESEISKKIKEELIDIIRKYQIFREIYLKLIKLLEKRNLTNEENEIIEKLLKKLSHVNQIQANIFTNLRVFRSLYNQYHIRDMNRILKERGKFVNYLTIKLNNLKRGNKAQQAVKKNWKDVLKENLYNIMTLSLKEKSQIIEIIQQNMIDDSNREKLVSILKKLPTEDLFSLLGRNFEKHTQNYVKWGWDYDIGVKKLMLSKYFKISRSEIEHYNRWFTDKIQNYIKNIENKIKFLFEPFKSFSKMDMLFGLGKSYILNVRMEKNSKKKISINNLERMRLSIKKNIQSWILKYPHLSDLLSDAQKYILVIIDEYEKILSPKPSARYQMYIHHPDFRRDYFRVIDSKEKAYWLGFLFADGWIALENKASGYYYRMGIGLSTKDKKVLIKFCIAVGLNADYIKDRLTGSDFSNKKYQISTIRWGDQEFAQDLIKHGIEYTHSEEKGRRTKIPNLPNLRSRELMLAFLLGFFDGDGTLGHDKITNRIYPSLTSSNKKFLRQIKDYFGIKNIISSRVIKEYNLRKDKMVKTNASALNIEVKLYEEMIKNYRNSIERKRVGLVFFDDYYEPKAKPPTPQRIWLRKKIPKDILKEIIKVLSPNMIAKLLGVNRNTIITLANEYGIYFFDGSYYKSISRFIHYQDKDSEFYKPYYRWLDYLKKKGKFRE